MTVITVTTAEVSKAEMGGVKIRNLIAGVDITAGQLLHIDANGKWGVADGNGVSPANRFRAIALESRKAGQPLAGLEEGMIYGFDLSGLAFDATVYVSDTAGSLDTAAGTTSLAVGKVYPVADVKTIKKVLYVTGIAG